MRGALWTAQLWLPCLAVAAVAATLVGVADALAAAQRQHARRDAFQSAVIADEVARQLSARHAPGRPLPSRVIEAVTGTDCAIDFPGGDAIEVRVPVHGVEHAFVGRLLEGAASEAFSYRSAVGIGAMGDGLPGAVTLPDPALPRPRPCTLNPIFPQRMAEHVRGLAPRYLAWGTDGADFRLTSSGDDALPPDRVVCCDGHVWIPPGEPVRLRLERDATVIVCGNLYLGDDLVVEGPGRLLLVAWAVNGRVFGDVDGDGYFGPDEPRWRVATFGHGAPEGQGAVHLGLLGHLPRSSSLRIDAAVVARGEIRAAVDTRLAGPAVATHGVRGPGIVLGGATWVLDVARDGFPGMATEGAPRPSLLQPMKPKNLR